MTYTHHTVQTQKARAQDESKLLFERLVVVVVTSGVLNVVFLLLLNDSGLFVFIGLARTVSA